MLHHTIFLITSRQQSCGRVIFWVASSQGKPYIGPRSQPSVHGPSTPQPSLQDPASPDILKFVQLGPHCTDTTPTPRNVQTCSLWSVHSLQMGIPLKCLLVFNCGYLLEGILKNSRENEFVYLNKSRLSKDWSERSKYTEFFVRLWCIYRWEKTIGYVKRKNTSLAVPLGVIN